MGNAEEIVVAFRGEVFFSSITVKIADAEPKSQVLLSLVTAWASSTKKLTKILE